MPNKHRYKLRTLWISQGRRSMTDIKLKFTDDIKKILRNKLYFAYTYKEIKNSKQLIKKVEKDIEHIELEITEQWGL